MEEPSLAHISDVGVTHPLYKHLTPASMLTLGATSKRFKDDTSLWSEYMDRSHSFEKARFYALTFLSNLLYGLILARPPPPQSADVTFGFKIDRVFTGVSVLFGPNVVQLVHQPSGLRYTTYPTITPRVDTRNYLLEFLTIYMNTITPRVFSKGGTVVGFTIISERPLQKAFVNKLRAATDAYKPKVNFMKRPDSKYELTIDINFMNPRSEVPPPYEPPLPSPRPSALQRNSAVHSAIQSTGIIGTAESQSLLKRGSLDQRMSEMRAETVARIASLRLR
jgi:hypothetical protein